MCMFMSTSFLGVGRADVDLREAFTRTTGATTALRSCPPEPRGQARAGGRRWARALIPQLPPTAIRLRVGSWFAPTAGLLNAGGARVQIDAGPLRCPVLFIISQDQLDPALFELDPFARIDQGVQFFRGRRTYAASAELAFSEAARQPPPGLRQLSTLSQGRKQEKRHDYQEHQRRTRQQTQHAVRTCVRARQFPVRVLPLQPERRSRSLRTAPCTVGHPRTS